MKDFFKEGLNALKSGGTSPAAQLACQQLKDFLSHVPESLNNLKKACSEEKDFNCLIATEVLIPLSSGCCLINKEITGVKEKRLKQPAEHGLNGLVIGKKILLLSSNKLRCFIISLPEPTCLLVSTKSGIVSTAHAYSTSLTH